LPLLADNIRITQRPTVKELPLDIAGSFWLDNPIGNIEIVGADVPNVSITAETTITGANRAAAKEGEEQTKVVFNCDSHMCLVRSLFPSNHDPHWTPSVNYVVRVPRTVHVRLASKSAEKIHVTGIMGNVTVKAFNGTITLDDVRGPSIVETVNGRVVYNFPAKPMSNVQVSAINAMIEVHLPSDSNFEWIGESLRNDFTTTFPARVRFTPGATNAFHASINAPNGPTITTATAMGSVRMIANGARAVDARSIFQQVVDPNFFAGPPAHDAPLIRQIQLPVVTSNFIYDVDIADLHVSEVRGDAQLTARAGSLELDRVFGDCSIESRGGPFNLGEIMGRLNVHTAVGNITIRAARLGGSAATDGGMIRVLYTGGPMTLRSGGGDIIVRQAGGAIVAETRSGDINITMDPTQKSTHIDAKTLRGNVVLNLTPTFAADVDATVLTSDPDADVLKSDFNGLAIRREQIGSKTKVHAVGKINGGGERVEIYSNEGTISISSQIGPTLTPVP